MKKFHKVTLLIFFSLLFKTSISYSQKSDLRYDLSLNSGVATQNTLPFWLTSNSNGAIPNADFFALNTSFFGSTVLKNSNYFTYKTSFTGYLTPANKAIINELYATFHFKKWHITAGSKNDEIVWHGLSSSNGNILKSTNTRALPGINIATNGYIKLPFAKNWLTAKFNYAEYLMNDKRVVENVHLHHKSLYFKSELNSKISIIAGLDHYVQWGGNSPIYGKQPSGFKDYLKIITGSSGGTGASEGDQINALGNTVGAYLFQVNFKGLKTNWNFYYSHPFEDRSGREMMNYPDALYGLFIDFKKPKGIISHLLTEVTYIRNNSGTSKEFRDAQGVWHAASGRDNYFNNFVYKSGWTYFGNTIGSPYFTATPLNEDGISNGIIVGDNRFVAINMGWNGTIFNLKYKTILSTISYVGWFDNEYQPRPNQFSGLLEVKIPYSKKMPFDITLISAFDTGTYRPVNFGGFIKLSRTGIF